MIALLLSPLGRIGLYFAAALAVVAAGAFVIHAHDARIRAEDAARVTAATVAEQARDAIAADAATTAAVNAERARVDALQAATRNIEAAPHAQDVVDDPAVNRALDALFGPAGSGDGQAKGSDVPVRLRPNAIPPAAPDH